MTDRDRSIDQLLRQELAADSPLPPEDCPDAEMLAALADDTLPAAARREIEGHVVGCHRCQAVTATMVRADVPADATPGAATEVPTWSRRALNWLVPAAAAATAVALWVLAPGQQAPTPVEPTSDQQVAGTPPSALAAPSTEVIVSEPLRIPDDATVNQLARMARIREESADVPAPEAAAATAAPPPPAAPSPTAPAEPALKAEARVAGSVTPAGEATGRDQAATPEQRSDAPNPTVAIQGRVAGLQARASFAPPDVMSPDPRVRWRIGPGPVVQRSADSGATWVTQQTGASAALTAGSAPAADVLWIVGRQGVVLRTTDGGRQWQRVPFPVTVDLTAITATSPRNATVVAADGRRFVTDDGGVTWSPAR